MHLADLRLRDFRNYERLDASFGPGFHLLSGRNAQGKTNLLEAIYLLATLRSFRGAGGAQMVRHGAKGYFVGGRIVGTGTAEVKTYWSPGERRLTLNGAPVRRVADYMGTLRAVVFCAEDVQLIKGLARVRRRFLDLLLVQSRPEYLPLLLRYTQALRLRNALLKRPQPDEDQLMAFSGELVRCGEALMTARSELVPEIAPGVERAFRDISTGADALGLAYHPSVRGDLAVAMANSRPRERIQRTTLVGPHRDDLSLTVNGQAAGPYTSEGQKRSLALALKMAQAEFLTDLHGTAPVLLIDDVLGELDAARRTGFLPLLTQCRRAGGQVFMTCTTEAGPRSYRTGPLAGRRGRFGEAR